MCSFFHPRSSFYLVQLFMGRKYGNYIILEISGNQKDCASVKVGSQGDTCSWLHTVHWFSLLFLMIILYGCPILLFSVSLIFIYQFGFFSFEPSNLDITEPLHLQSVYSNKKFSFERRVSPIDCRVDAWSG